MRQRGSSRSIRSLGSNGRVLSRSDFTDEEWTRLKRTPFVIAVAKAAPQDGDRAIAQTWAELRRTTRGPGGHLAALLAEELVTEDPSSTDPLAGLSREREYLWREVRSAMRLASAKVSEAEASAYREWFLFISSAAARAEYWRTLRTEPIDVGVDSFYAWSDAEAEALASAFRRAGFQPRIGIHLYVAAAVTEWVITVTVATPVVAFFQSFGSELGKDAYIHLKQWFHHVRDRGPGKGSIVVRSSRPGLSGNVVLDSDLPDEALEALTEGQPLGTSEYIGWDPDEHAWVPVIPSADAGWKFDSFVPGHGTPYRRVGSRHSETDETGT
jgi:hypothetical protein